MNEVEMKQVFAILQAVYPGSELFQGMVKERVKIWTEIFKDIPARKMTDAVMTHIKSNKFAPTISELNDFLKTSAVNADEEIPVLWDTLINATEKMIDLRHDFNYTMIDDDTGKTQGQLARENSERMYFSLPKIIRSFFGSYSGFLRFSCDYENLSPANINWEKGKFETFVKNSIGRSDFNELFDIPNEDSHPQIDTNASYDIDLAIEQMKKSVPKLKKGVEKNGII